MKKLQLLFTALAILVAGAGVFASARRASGTIYYRAPDAQFGVTGKLCGVVISLPPTCDGNNNIQCEEMFETQLPNEEAPSLKSYSISKKVDDNPCEEVWRIE
jgi:hypothetical protein